MRVNYLVTHSILQWTLTVSVLPTCSLDFPLVYQLWWRLDLISLCYSPVLQLSLFFSPLWQPLYSLPCRASLWVCLIISSSRCEPRQNALPAGLLWLELRSKPCLVLALLIFLSSCRPLAWAFSSPHYDLYLALRPSTTTLSSVVYHAEEWFDIVSANYLPDGSPFLSPPLTPGYSFDYLSSILCSIDSVFSLPCCRRHLVFTLGMCSFLT